MEQIITLALFSVWITGWYTPLNKYREYVIDKYIRLCMRFNVPSLMDLIVILTCSKCFGFIFTLIYTQSFVLALSVSFTAFLINFVINQINRENG